MSEKEKEKEKEKEEEVILDHWSHEHPLTLVETSIQDNCYGCKRYFSSGEQGYGCSYKCGYHRILHQECAEMAKKIIHPMHPQHTLIQQQKRAYTFMSCSVCNKSVYSGYMIFYNCTSLECSFMIHVGCGVYEGVMDANNDEQGHILRHPSHPQHDLRLLRRAEASCSFKCDACGTTQKGSSYICSLCQFWIHERCASLDSTIEREDHHHPLSLSFSVPHVYLLNDYKCDVCFKHLVPKYWIYHCQLCSYVVHVKCAFKKSLHSTIINLPKDIIQFPMNDVAEELIRPFIMRQGGAIAAIPNDDERVNAKYEFHCHKHKLNLISSSPNDENEEEENSDDDDDYGTKSELICDACITPISSSSSSSSSSNKYFYMSCGECKYFLHYACFHLPPRLPSLPHLHEHDHDLVLYSCPKLDFETDCRVCDRHSNGLFYACQGCSFIVDIKCASLPDTIYHKAHPHLLKFLDRNKEMFSHNKYIQCGAGCGRAAGGLYSYVCDDCEFMLHNRCVMLPASTKTHEWDMKHPLPLTYDANIDHPGEMYCNHCEEEMNPKMWMYHCRHCDLYFHPDCFPATSSYLRNIKFGHKYAIVAAHPHPLTYQLLTTKRHCNACLQERYGKPGFHCASCNFSICLYWCGAEMLSNGDIQPID